MRLLVCGDLHLKPAGSDYDVDAVAAPSDVDAAVVLGDLTHRAGDEDVALARRVVERLASSVPVVYIPGNHDPAPTEEQVVEPIDGAESGHCAVHEFGDCTVVGWGCERRTLPLAIDQREFDALDPRDVPRGDRRYAADQSAADLEAACYGVVCGDRNRDDAAAELGISREERPAFESGLEEIRATYDRLSALLAGRSDVLLATHVPPFNTSFDRHHAVGTRADDLEFLHLGSIGLKLAVREHDVFAALSGHSHTQGYDVGEGADGRPYCLNLGFRGIGTIDVNPVGGAFSFTQTAGES